MAAPLRLTQKCRERDLADVQRVMHRLMRERNVSGRRLLSLFHEVVRLMKKRLRAGRGQGANLGSRRRAVKRSGRRA